MTTNNKDNKKEVNKTGTPRKHTQKRKRLTEKQKQESQIEMQKVSNLTLATGILIIISAPIIYVFSLGSGLSAFQFINVLYFLYIFAAIPAGVIVSMIAGARVRKLRGAIGEVPHDQLWKKYIIGRILCLLPALFLLAVLIFLSCMFYL